MNRSFNDALLFGLASCICVTANAQQSEWTDFTKSPGLSETQTYALASDDTVVETSSLDHVVDYAGNAVLLESDTIILDDTYLRSLKTGKIAYTGPGVEEIISMPEGRISVVFENGNIDTYDSNLNLITPPALEPPGTFALFPPYYDPIIALSWTDVSGENGYRVERRIDDGPWALLASPRKNSVSFNDHDIILGESYEYRVFARSNDNLGPPSETIGFNYAYLDPPTGVTVERISADQVGMNWNQIPGLNDYNIWNRHEIAPGIFSEWRIVEMWSEDSPLSTDDYALVMDFYAPDAIHEYAVSINNDLSNDIRSESVSIVSGDYLVAGDVDTPFLIANYDPGTGEVFLLAIGINDFDFVTFEKRHGGGNWETLRTSESEATYDFAFSANETVTYRAQATLGSSKSGYSNERPVSIPGTLAEDRQPKAPTLNVEFRGDETISLIGLGPSRTIDVDYQYRVQPSQAWIDIPDPEEIWQPVFVDASDLSDATVEARMRITIPEGTSEYSEIGSTLVSRDLWIFNDTFDDGISPSVWNEVSGGRVVSDLPDVSDGKGSVLYFDGDGPRYAITKPFFTPDETTVNFWVKIGTSENVDTGFWDPIESPILEGLILEWSYDRYDWNEVAEIDSFTDGSESEFSFSVIRGSIDGSPIYLRISQLSHSGEGFDVWALDNFWIESDSVSPTVPPYNLRAVATDAHTVALNWDPIPNAESYSIEQTYGNYPSPDILQGFVTGTSYTNSGLVAQSVPSYRIRARVNGDWILYSKYVTVQTPTAFDAWADRNNVNTGLRGNDLFVTSAVTGRSQLETFAFLLDQKRGLRLDPNNLGQGGLPMAFIDADGRLCVRFLRRRIRSRADIYYHVEYSIDGVIWESAGREVQATDIDGTVELVDWEDDRPADEYERRFVRVRVTVNRSED